MKIPHFKILLTAIGITAALFLLDDLVLDVSPAPHPISEYFTDIAFAGTMYVAVFYCVITAVYFLFRKLLVSNK